jgi:hypothetical protein
MKKNIFDTYLAQNGTTRYQVAKQSGLRASTLQRVAESPKGIKNMTIRIISAVALTVNKPSGTVVEELIALQKEKGLW